MKHKLIKITIIKEDNKPQTVTLKQTKDGGWLNLKTYTEYLSLSEAIVELTTDVLWRC